MRKPKDRDFLETVEGMFFCVTGYLHPPEKITAYLKYSPVTEGKWKKNNTSFRRELPFYHVFSVSKTIQYLKEKYPQYVQFCPVRSIEMSLVPMKYITQYYEPETRMHELFFSPQDELEEKVKTFAQDIMDKTRIPLSCLGITGSILTGLHNPSFSDIDLIVYGRENSITIKERLPALEDVGTLTGERQKEWVKHKMNIFNMSKKQAEKFSTRKWNYGFYKNTYFSVHPTRADTEITERYGDVHYTGRGAATIQAEVIDSSESMFLPATYKIELHKTIEGEPVPIDEIVSYEGVYCDVFKEGEKIEARGRLEQVNDRYQLVLGTLEVEKQYIRFV